MVQKRSKPRARVAIGPNQIYGWGISYLPTEVRGIYFYLYLLGNLFSRQIVGRQVYDCESAAAGQRVAPSDLRAPGHHGKSAHRAFGQRLAHER